MKNLVCFVFLLASTTAFSADLTAALGHGAFAFGLESGGKVYASAELWKYSAANKPDGYASFTGIGTPNQNQAVLVKRSDGKFKNVITKVPDGFGYSGFDDTEKITVQADCGKGRKNCIAVNSQICDALKPIFDRGTDIHETNACILMEADFKKAMEKVDFSAPIKTISREVNKASEETGTSFAQEINKLTNVTLTKAPDTHMYQIARTINACRRFKEMRDEYVPPGAYSELMQRAYGLDGAVPEKSSTPPSN